MSKHTIQRHLVNVAIPSGVDTSQSLTSLINNVVPQTGQNLPDSMLQLSRQMEQLRAINQISSDTLAANTLAIAQNTAVQGSGKGVGSTIGNAASGLFSNALNALPLVSGLTRLFRGSAPDPLPTLLPYIQPAPIHVDQSIGGSGLSQTGTSAYQQPASASGRVNQFVGLNTILASTPLESLAKPDVGQSVALSALRAGPGEAVGVEPSQRNVPSISIQVNAMDSRSFLDHSHDIALAVRDAMLNLNALNDVVNDL